MDIILEQRIQLMIWVVFILAIILIVAHAVKKKEPLCREVLLLLGMLCLCLLLDKMSLTFFSVKFGSSVHIEAKSTEGADEKVAIQPPGGPGVLAPGLPRPHEGRAAGK